MPMSTHLWSKIQAAGVKPNITTLEQYEEVVILGLIRARLQAQFEPNANPDATIISAYHQLIFEQVYPWAGQFRGFGELTVVGGAVGAEWDRIGRELEMLKLQTAELLAQARSEGDILQALAFAHVRFERIHPFRDGNGRVGRVLLDGQLNATLGLKVRPRLEREQYLAALRTCQQGELTEMVTLLGQREGISYEERRYAAPFRLAPFMADGVERSLDDDLSRSRLGVR